jgi:spore coat protein U-like protein
MPGLGSTVPGYALASNSHGTVNRGQTVGTDKVAGTVNGSARTLSVNGQIPLGQNVAAGASADAITVTVTY